MTQKHNAESLAKAVLDGRLTFDAALEEHLDNYQGRLEIPSLSKVYLALGTVNLGQPSRSLDLDDGPITVAEIVSEFSLEPFLPLLNRTEDFQFSIGQIVTYEGAAYQVIGRREVWPFAAPRTDDWELLIEALGGGTSAFVGESEVEPVEEVTGQ